MDNQIIQVLQTIDECNEKIQYIDAIRILSKGVNIPTINAKVQKPGIPQSCKNGFDKYKYQSNYYQLNKEYFAQYREKNKERNRLYQQKYNAKRRAQRIVERTIKRLAEKS